MMEDWQSFAFSQTETNSTKIGGVAAFEMYLTTKLMKNIFFSSVHWHHEKHVSLSEEETAFQ